MSGGTFQSQNKVRAGAYINFESVPKPMTKVGTRGIATIAIPLSWGPQLIELYSTDLTDGSSLAKVGLDVTDEEALILRKHLTHTYKSFIYRLDVNGKKAEATVGTKKFTAKYEGAFGNNIQIVVVQNLFAYTGSTTGKFFAGEELAQGTIIYSDANLDNVKGVVTAYSNTDGIKIKVDNAEAEETVTVQTDEATTYTVQTIVNGVKRPTNS